jgi:type IV fimbrial biogenesis protein FimT
MCKEASARCLGLTTIELMISLAIVSILTAIAIPSMRDMYLRNLAQSTLSQLAQLVLIARNEAIGQRVPTTLCPSADGHTCSGTWDRGVLLFTDRNLNRQLDSDDRILRWSAPLVEQGELQWRSLRQAIQFNPRGMPHGTVGNFVYCPARGRSELGAARILSFQGRLRKGTDGNHDGIVETSQGNNIRC